MRAEQKHEIVRTMGLDVPVDSQTEHLLCPFCNGGSSGEKSFQIYRNRLGLYYVCYRNKCKKKGFVSSIPSSFFEHVESPKTQKVYEGEQVDLDEQDLEYLLHRWGLKNGDVLSQRIKKDDESQRIVFPLFTLEGYEFGHVLRSIKGDKPKVLSFWDNENRERIHFPLCPWYDRRVIVVEDVPSAIRASHYMRAAAIMGTHISEDVALYLSKNFDSLYLALDADATQQAIKMRSKYGLLFRNFSIVVLSKGDVKDLSEDEVKELMCQLQ